MFLSSNPNPPTPLPMDHVDTDGGAATEGFYCPEKENISMPSAVRVGLKRELAFALKSQAELSETLGRSRHRKPPSSSVPAETQLASTPAINKRDRKKSGEFFSPDVRILKTNPMATLEKSTEKVPVLPHQSSARPGFSAEIPIVLDDVDTGGRATDNVALGRGAESSSMPVHVSDVTVPGWLEQQVSRITRAGSKYVLQGMEEAVFYGSEDGTANFDSGIANTSARFAIL
ncbi:hypothetical protein MA16_Dca028676 [Dendrobium catenatum]|uniref:Uncharacterized protein n=1 Tax=Dendrobium catenatum TaxID=906689 RepID=A0A2I0VAB1_9ASPA|nr:hypothetical protein MA16_Dca028676 [Dendrobium catenatum]